MNESIGAFIGFDFKQQVSLYKIKIYGYTVDGPTYWGRSIRKAKIEYSNDSTNWHELETITTDFTQNDYDKYNEIELTKKAEGRYWRIVVTQMCEARHTQTGTSEIKFFATKNRE